MAYSGYGKAPEVWTEEALVCIEQEDAAAGDGKLYFKTITDTVDFDLGEKGMESIATIGGGRLAKFSPETDSTVTLELFPIAAGNYWSSSCEEGAGFYDLLNSHAGTYDPAAVAGSAYQAIVNDHTRTRYRLTVLWTNDTSATDPTAAIVSGNYAALRISCCGWFTKVSPSFTDDSLKVTATMKIPAFKKDATANIQVASTDKSSTTNITALATFTSTTNF